MTILKPCNVGWRESAPLVFAAHADDDIGNLTRAHVLPQQSHANIEHLSGLRRRH
jgi:hypothetical protein